MKKKFVAGNWKMHGTGQSIRDLTTQLAFIGTENVDVAVFPPFVYLEQVQQTFLNSAIKLGAQNLYLGDAGAFTGEVSGPMLKDIGCEYVLVGHSERRQIFGEDLALIQKKLQASLAAGLKPILCVGETQAEREQGQTKTVILKQLASAITGLDHTALRSLTLAYEPVWAIGTGLTATPEEAQVVHAAIRAYIQQQEVALASTMRILYGGSVKADNAAGLFSMPDIDGALVGGAALDAKQFVAICQAAATI